MLARTQLIAPCGMNCSVCMAHLREKRKCLGCHGEDTSKSITRVNCTIRNCQMIKQDQSKFCFKCVAYPCKRLKQLDRRYRTKYSMSMIENLEFIKEKGLDSFAEKENDRWRCKKCGGIICVHWGYCYQCGEEPAKIQHNQKS